MDKRLIDADKLLAHINSIRNDHIEKRNEGDECDRFANDAVTDWLFILSNDIEKGIFDPDPIPLPTIKPEDWVYHTKFKAKGQVKRISESGKRAYVIWINGAAPSFVDLKSLEVVSHD